MIVTIISVVRYFNALIKIGGKQDPLETLWQCVFPTRTITNPSSDDM
jgi:hypothetical protein